MWEATPQKVSRVEAPVDYAIKRSFGQQDEDDVSYAFLGLYSIILWFITGFWRAYSTLVLKESCRDPDFQWLADVKDRITVAISINVSKKFIN